MIAFLGRDLTWELIAALVATIGEMILVPFSQALRADLMDGEPSGNLYRSFFSDSAIASVLSGILVSLSSLYGNIGMTIFMFFIYCIRCAALTTSNSDA